MLRLLVLCLFAVPAFADPPRTIRLPAVTPVVVTPPANEPVTKIKPGEWYVFDTDIPVACISSPEGFVKITVEEQACPIKFRGIFAGGTGTTETRTFAGKYLVTVEAIATGKCELIVIPIGLKNASEIERRMLEVEAGHGPQPPPVIIPPPATGKLYFLIVRGEGPASASFAAAMSQPAWADLAKQGHLFKDKTLAESRAFNVQIPDGTILPTVVTLKYNPDGKTMSQVRGPTVFPTTPELILRLPEGVTK